MFGNTDQFDAGQLALIERRAGLTDLRFDSALAADGGREVQSLHDAQGRIVGWFSWAPDRALIHTMNGLWETAAVLGIALALAAALMLAAAQRLTRVSQRSRERLRRLTTQDPLTGLANRRVTLARLDAIMAARGDGRVVFALLESTASATSTICWAGPAATR